MLAAVNQFVESLADYPAELAPLVAGVERLAGRLDEDSSDAGVWREFRFMLRDLREAAGGSDLTENLEKEFAKLDS